MHKRTITVLTAATVVAFGGVMLLQTPADAGKPKSPAGMVYECTWWDYLGGYTVALINPKGGVIDLGETPTCDTNAKGVIINGYPEERPYDPSEPPTVIWPSD